MDLVPARNPDAASPESRDEILTKLRERIVGFAASRLQRDVAEDFASCLVVLSWCSA